MMDRFVKFVSYATTSLLSFRVSHMSHACCGLTSPSCRISCFCAPTGVALGLAVLQISVVRWEESKRMHAQPVSETVFGFEYF